jgi:ubiquinone/menaquinone biosynthesis C-methylase UbiE
LEIGCGPGWAIQRIAAAAVAGFVACVDISEVMARMARERNALAVQDGRAEFKLGSALALPYEGEAFDKVLAVNSLHHWAAPAQGLRETWRVLAPGGLLVIVEQPRVATSEAGLQKLTQDLTDQLASAGFQQIRSATKAMRPAAGVAVMGLKQLDRSSG